MNGIRQELLEYVTEWARLTEERLQDRVKSWRATDTEALLNSIRLEVYERSAGLLGVDVSFLTYGRYVDMGVGRGHGRQAARVTREAYRERHEAAPRRVRRAKKWYGRTFYGRLNALSDVVATQLVDESIDTILTGVGRANNFNYNTP